MSVHTGPMVHGPTPYAHDPRRETPTRTSPFQSERGRELRELTSHLLPTGVFGASHRYVNWCSPSPTDSSRLEDRDATNSETLSSVKHGVSNVVVVYKIMYSSLGELPSSQRS